VRQGYICFHENYENNYFQGRARYGGVWSAGVRSGGARSGGAW
jgi:hypothetical protein